MTWELICKAVGNYRRQVAGGRVKQGRGIFQRMLLNGHFDGYVGDGREWRIAGQYLILRKDPTS